MWRIIALDDSGKIITTVNREDMNSPPNKLDITILNTMNDKLKSMVPFDRSDYIIDNTTKLWFKTKESAEITDWTIVFYDTDRANLHDTIDTCVITLPAGVRPGKEKNEIVECQLKRLKLFQTYAISAIAEEAHIKTLKVFLQKKKTNKVDWVISFFNPEGILLASSTVQAYDGFKPTEDQIACAMVKHDLETTAGYLRYDEDTKNRRINIVLSTKEQTMDKYQRLVAANKELIRQRAIISVHKSECDKRQEAADKLQCSINATRAMITSLLTDVKSDSTEIKKFRLEQVTQKSAELRLLEDSFEKEMETIIGLKQQSLNAQISYDAAFVDIIYILEEHRL